VGESGPGGYARSDSANCSGTIAVGETKTCTITNDDIAPKLIVIKHVINDNGGTATAASFTMTVTGSSPSPASFPGAESPGTTITLNAGSYSVSETGPSGYAMTASGSCTGTAAIGETKTCTITNDDIAPKLVVIKHVINDNGGTATAASFTMTVTGTSPSPASFAGAESPGTTVTLNAGTYSVGESGPSGYARSDSANCSGSIAVGETKTCTVTNNDLYLFSGFFSPVDNLPALNLANAGQAIPVKWAITTLNNVVVSDSTSFVSLESYQVACATNDPLTTPIEEYAAGGSGLQYVGNGNWQFVWKTPKTYAGTCRVILLNLSDGTQHKANFKFK
jgi:hypothetical protein